MLSRFLFKPRQPQLIIGSDVVLRYLGPSGRQGTSARIFMSCTTRISVTGSTGLVSDPWLDKYIARSLNEAIVIGAYVGDHLVAVAELHTGGQIPEHVAESAFSVASDWRRKGLGTILLKALLRAASENEISTIIVETGSQNHAMKALARKFGARMQFASEQSVGRINVADGLRLAARDRAHRHFSRRAAAQAGDGGAGGDGELRD